MRKAFSMVTAIIVIVLMATVAMFIMNLSGKMVKGTAAQFLREQSVLLAKSYTEYAILAVTANDQNSSSCLNNISGTYGIYNVDVNISYIGTSDYLGTGSNCSRKLDSTVSTKESPVNIIVDVFVSYTNPSRPDNQKVTYHRRSLQKI